MVECVFCDEKFEDTQFLCEHLGAFHLGVVANGRPLTRSKRGTTILCFCGSYFSHRVVARAFFGEEGPSRWAKHIERRGGLAAHILELTLGVKHK